MSSIFVTASSIVAPGFTDTNPPAADGRLPSVRPILRSPISASSGDAITAEAVTTVSATAVAAASSSGGLVPTRDTVASRVTRRKFGAVTSP